MLKIVGKCRRWVYRRLSIVTNLTAESIALRHQLIVLKRNQNGPTLKERDAVVIVKPDTVARWHKRAFKLYWLLKMADANSTWCAPKIRGELLKLGIEISERTHLRLHKDTPMGRPVSNRASRSARLVELPRVEGLHHRYEWSEAA